MINLSKSGDTIVFVFDDNGHYLQNGTIEVPMNSLSLVTDDSNMATFKKAATNDIFVSALYSEFGMTKDELIAFYKENMVGGGGLPTEEIQDMIDASISGMADNASYDSVSQEIKFYNGNTEVYSVDASDFVIDGMIDETISGVSYLVIDFNTASGKEDIQIPLTDIFDPSNYYTKQEVDASLSGKQDTLIEGIGINIDDNVISVENPSVYLTQAEYDALVSGGTVDPDTYYVISDATAIDINQYYTSAQTNSAISAAVSGKADTSAVTASIEAATSGKVDSSSVVTAVTSGSTDSEIPTAKAVFDAIPTGSSITVSSAITSGDTNPIAGGAVYDKFDEVETVTARALIDLNDKFGGLKLQQISQANYDALVSGGTVDASTLYIITNVVN